jgi:HECT-domain (ubiquitin-transferase)/SPRY domain
LDVSKSRRDDDDCAVSVDARLIAFLSGLLLSKPLQPVCNFGSVQQDLFEAWSVGLLSASLPWRMICAFTASGILNQNPSILSAPLNETPTLARYFGRLQSTVARRLWAERAAFPVCSRYAQSMVELVTSVHRAVAKSENLPSNFLLFWGNIQVDAATPLPFHTDNISPGKFWQSDEGWISSDSGWDIWTGTVELKPVNWKTPSRSTVRNLMDGGDGPPLVREGCIVMRGIDWDQAGCVYGNVDGKDAYDVEKANRESEKRALHESERPKNSSEDASTPNVSEVVNVDIENTASMAPDPAEETYGENPLDSSLMDTSDQPDPLPVSIEEAEAQQDTQTENVNQPDKRNKRIPSPKLPVGTVLSIEPWNGIPGMARRVRWHRTGIEGVYRFGGDGGMYDLCHVDVNSKETKIKKRHPLPESSEQCASRHGFGVKTIHNVLLRIRRSGDMVTSTDSCEYYHEGILEWPDFGAGVRVACNRLANGTIIIEERQLLFGSKDTGWTPRFGRPSFISGSRYVLTVSSNTRKTDSPVLSLASSLYEEISGISEIDVDILRNPADGSCLKLSSEMRLNRGISGKALHANDCDLPPSLSPLPPPLTFDPDYRAQSLSLCRDCRTVSCNASDGCRGTVFGSIGFTKGTHYWEVKLEQADVGSVFIGVAEKPIGSGSGSSYTYDSTPRLNRWHGWGFVNFRATYTSGAERVFGSHCHAGDTVGVMLDCDAGRVSFFFDGLKYGEHILNDLGCAFENLSPFGFNVDGCGSGGIGQGAPSGFENGSSSRYPAQGTIKPRTLWPVIGLRNLGDRVTLSPKWSTSFGTDGVMSLRNILRVDEILNAYSDCIHMQCSDAVLPQWCINEAFLEYTRWCGDSWTLSATRGVGPYRGTGCSLNVDFDASPISCAAASASLGLEEVLLAGDHVKLPRSAGRILQLDEEAVVVGVYQGRLYYKITSQKSEGGSLAEGGGRAWCWDESEVVDGLPFVAPSKGRGVKLPRLARFTCLSSGGLKVIYDKGAVLRSDLEIFDGSEPLGTIPVDTVIPRDKVIDRRTNSCGGLRYRVITENFGEGWISARIRGGSEDPIVEAVVKTEVSIDMDQAISFVTPMECALAWYKSWKDTTEPEENSLVQSLLVNSVEQFADLLSQGIIPGRSAVESDSILTAVVNAIGNYSSNGDAVELKFQEVVAAVSYGHATTCGDKYIPVAGTNAATNQATATVFSGCENLPSILALLARIALLRSINRRARLALPWISIRPCQEGSSILGGLNGHGTSPDRAGRSHIADSELWVQVPSMATKIRALRGLLFTSVKRDFLLGIVDATTTPTLLSHDEYELPREIRTVRINRLKAARAMLGDDRSAKRKYSVFSQLLSETKNWGGASLRRGFVAKGHGGQKRAFKVKLIGEGVNDYSGPYREAFTDAMADVLKIEDGSRCSLPVFDPTPNNASSMGESRDLYMFSLNGRIPSPSVPLEFSSPAEDRIRRSFASLMVPSDESSREVEESLVFLGRLVGTAFRHGIPSDIPLPLASVWKAITEEPVTSSEKLRELDLLAYKQLTNEAEADRSPLLLWQQRMLNAFTEGLSNVLPVEVLPLLSGEELRELMCGNPQVDVDLLKQVVEYEGYSATDAVIGYFWQTLTEMTTEERKQFLQFVWARNRLPTRESDFDAPFKIQKDTKSAAALPSASTCFFTLTLPEYSSPEALREKLLFAIRNVTTMETDFQTNSAEIAEGYRSF